MVLIANSIQNSLERREFYFETNRILCERKQTRKKGNFRSDLFEDPKIRSTNAKTCATPRARRSSEFQAKSLVYYFFFFDTEVLYRTKTCTNPTTSAVRKKICHTILNTTTSIKKLMCVVLAFGLGRQISYMLFNLEYGYLKRLSPIWVNC